MPNLLPELTPEILQTEVTLSKNLDRGVFACKQSQLMHCSCSAAQLLLEKEGVTHSDHFFRPGCEDIVPAYLHPRKRASAKCAGARRLTTVQRVWRESVVNCVSNSRVLVCGVKGRGGWAEIGVGHGVGQKLKIFILTPGSFHL